MQFFNFIHCLYCSQNRLYKIGCVATRMLSIIIIYLTHYFKEVSYSANETHLQKKVFGYVFLITYLSTLIQIEIYNMSNTMGQLTLNVVGQHRVLKCHLVVSYRSKVDICPTIGLAIWQAGEVHCQNVAT